MTNTYLLELIKALQPAERKEMALFLASPHFNGGGNSKELRKLYQIIVNEAPDFLEAMLRKEQVYRKVYPGQSVVPGKLEKLMTELVKLLRSYVLTQRYFSENKEAEQQTDWAAWLRERGLHDRSLYVMTKLIRSKEGEQLQSLDLYRTKLLILEEVHEWESTHNQAKGDLNIPELVCQLDLFYHTYRTELLNRYLLQQKSVQLPNLESIESKINQTREEVNLLKISAKVNDLLGHELPSVSDFQDLMSSLKRYENMLSFQMLAQFYAYLRNFCTLLINGGNLEFIPILHEIQKDNLFRGYFFIKGEISPNSYLNIVQIATRAREFEWAKRFTEDYKKLIIGGDGEELFYGLNMAQCFFAEGNFEEALQYLPDTQSSSHYHLLARRLELKIYYELNSELLLYKIDAFRKFIQRTAPKNIASNLGAMNLNFLNILLQLSQSPAKDKVRSARLVKRIEEKKLLAERSWLLEKARELG